MLDEKQEDEEAWNRGVMYGWAEDLEIYLADSNLKLPPSDKCVAVTPRGGRRINECTERMGFVNGTVFDL